MSQEVVVVDDVAAANDDSSSSDEPSFAGSGPDSDNEDEGAAPDSEGNGAAEKGDEDDVCTALGKRPARDKESIVWKYYKTVEGDSNSVICTLCTPNKTFKTGGGTSNMKGHVCRKHTVIARADGLMEATAKSVQTNLYGVVVFAPSYLRRAVKWIVMNYLTLVKMLQHEDKTIQGASKAALADVDQRWNFEPKANASGKAGLSDVHLICACTDPRAKRMKFLPRAFRKYSWEALKEVILSGVALKVTRKRDADIAAGLVPDGESNEGGGSANSNGDAGEVEEEGADGKPKSLVRMVLEGTDSDGEDSGSDEDDWGNYDTAPEKTDEYTHMKTQYDAQVNKELVQYRALDPLGPNEDPLQWWATHDQDFPLIGDVAARYLCSSASSASSERLFSKAGLTMTKKRMRLTGDSIARIISVRGAIVSGLLDSYYELP